MYGKFFLLMYRDTVLVNRGWVPLQLADPKTRVGGQVTGTLKIMGLLRSTEKVSYSDCFYNLCIIYMTFMSGSVCNISMS